MGKKLNPDDINLTDFLMDNLTTAVFLVDKDMRVKKINNAYKALFEKEEYDVLNKLCGNSIGCSFAVEENRPCGTTQNCSECMLRKCILNSFEKEYEVQNSYISRKFYIENEPKMKYFRIKTKHVKYSGEEMAIIAIDDITELEEEKNAIRDMAQRDYLTKLYNRMFLFEAGENMFQNFLRGNIKIAVAMVDIDFFKKINDGYGHAAGDFVIKSVADIFSSELRKSDIVARYGGEEFCVILVIKDSSDSVEVMEKLRKSVENHKFIYENEEIPVTISIGVTCEMKKSFEESLKVADELLYASKENGRNRVTSK